MGHLPTDKWGKVDAKKIPEPPLHGLRLARIRIRAVAEATGEKPIGFSHSTKIICLAKDFCPTCDLQRKENEAARVRELETKAGKK